MAVDRVLDELKSREDASLARLFELLSIPSVSADPAYASSVGDAAQWCASALEAAGLATGVRETTGHPIVLAHTPRREGARHIVFYGHYDVQPPDPVDLWETPAFEPTVRDGAVFARGAADDKGPVVCFLEALRAWHDVAGECPCDVSVILEGEEETGSSSLAGALGELGDAFQGDALIISDTNMWDADTPAITYGLRGMLYLDIQLHNANRDLHSGMYGGILANPANELMRVLGQIHDESGRITVPGFYDDVAPVTDEERARWSQLDLDIQRDWLDPVGVSQPFGEAGADDIARKWARPTCDFNGLYGGYGGAGGKTIIPSFAGAKLSFRLAPNQDPHRIEKLVVDWIRAHDVHGCRWEITNHGYASPVVTPTDSPFIEATSRAAERVFGKPAVLIREGATIPIVGQFKQSLGLDAVMLGFDLPDDAIHAPNEHLGLDRFHKGCRTHAALLAEIAAL